MNTQENEYAVISFYLREHVLGQWILTYSSLHSYSLINSHHSWDATSWKIVDNDKYSKRKRIFNVIVVKTKDSDFSNIPGPQM